MRPVSEVRALGLSSQTSRHQLHSIAQHFLRSILHQLLSNVDVFPVGDDHRVSECVEVDVRYEPLSYHGLHHLLVDVPHQSAGEFEGIVAVWDCRAIRFKLLSYPCRYL
jgi:hypothetical protein